MSTEPAAVHSLSIGVGGEPPPPLAGALAAWWMRRGDRVVVIDGRGRDAPLSPEADHWVHLEGRVAEGRLDGPPERSTFFGPGVDSPEVRDALRRRFPNASIRAGDPVPVADLAELPITTWAGFGPQSGAFRILAGRGDRVRPVAQVVREIVYGVETHEAGHYLFDDADLGAYPGWIAAFEDELARLPWRVTWEAAVRGRRRTSSTTGT